MTKADSPDLSNLPDSVGYCRIVILSPIADDGQIKNPGAPGVIWRIRPPSFFRHSSFVIRHSGEPGASSKACNYPGGPASLKEPFDIPLSPDHTPTMLETIPRPNASRGMPPPLENGDHLTAHEFMRRYEAMPHLKKAELIEGVVSMGSSVRYALRGRPGLLLQGWLGMYEAHTPGVETVSNTTTQLDIDNVPQPDSQLRIVEECGGQSKVDQKDYLEGAPELVVEVAASTASIDTSDKLRAYRRNGVREYWVWLVEEKEIRCLRLTEGEYEMVKPELDGKLCSAVFPGLWLDIKAALALDSAGLLRTLEAGLRTTAHRQFVKDLATAKAAPRKRA